jgi:hypothetical protein
MRTYEEYEKILDLWELGVPKKRIAITLAIPRGTVTDCIKRYGSLKGLEENKERATKSTPDRLLQAIQNSQNVTLQEAYAYLLGIYLGDGSISKNRKIFRLRITLDKKYPNIVNTCVRVLQTLFPSNDIGIIDHEGCVDVSCYHKHWPAVFPQHGTGRKHEREIKLEDWQEQIVTTYPLEFFRGLYHSDGSRFSNVVNGKDYPRYQFTNISKDISRLFCETCDRLGLHWTIKHRRSLSRDKATDIFISRRRDVEYLDRAVGPKS